MEKLILGFIVISTILSAQNIPLQQAAGKTHLSADKCSKKAENAFTKLNLSDIRTRVNLSDGKNVSRPSENSPRTTKAYDSERTYSIH